MVKTTSWMGVDDGRVVDDLPLRPRGNCDAVRPDPVHATRHVEEVGGRRHLYADIHRVLAVEANFRLVVLGAERDIGDVLQAHDSAVGLLDDELAELAADCRAGRGGHGDLTIWPLVLPMPEM